MFPSLDVGPDGDLSSFPGTKRIDAAESGGVTGIHEMTDESWILVMLVVPDLTPTGQGRSSRRREHPSGREAEAILSVAVIVPGYR